MCGLCGGAFVAYLDVLLESEVCMTGKEKQELMAKIDAECRQAPTMFGGVFTTVVRIVDVYDIIRKFGSE